jgi:hypothetical protein
MIIIEFLKNETSLKEKVPLDIKSIYNYFNPRLVPLYQVVKRFNCEEEGAYAETQETEVF